MQAIELTRECLCHFWQLDVDFVLRQCGKDVIWVGSEQSRCMSGLEAMTADIHEILGSLKPCHLMSQQFSAVSSGDTVTVVGRYLTTTDGSVEYFIQVQQRCTFVWHLEKEQWRIRHIHVSNPMGELKVAPGEHFVNAMGKMARQYMEKRIASLQNARRLTVRDANGATQFIQESEIITVSARNKRSVVSTVNGEIQVMVMFAELLEQLGPDFARVHRGHAVNLNYVKKLERYQVEMANGEIVPVPLKKYDEVEELLLHSHKAGK